MSDVAIVVPVYRPSLTPVERMALRRCERVLGSYPRILACPAGMVTTAYEEVLPRLQFQRFDGSHFKSERTYSRLLRLPAFYERFLDHEHILIYQADAYAFSDQLPRFCAQPYDYIGAPWLNFDWLSARRRWARFVVGLPHLMNRVGNGGFSLRRTRAHYDVARRFRFLGERLDMNEDLYFTSLLARLDRSFRVADFTTALQFAFELEPRRSFELNGGRLPFGCHAFARYDVEFWKQYMDRGELVEAGLIRDAAS